MDLLGELFGPLLVKVPGQVPDEFSVALPASEMDPLWRFRPDGWFEGAFECFSAAWLSERRAAVWLPLNACCVAGRGTALAVEYCVIIPDTHVVARRF